MFTFAAFDGRTGSGPTTWAAIVAALGRHEAYSLPDLREPQWTYPWDRATGVRREAYLEAADGTILGTITESES